MGEIYLLTSPSGKYYVGQCFKYLSNGKKNGYLNRWKGHIAEANSPTKDCSRLLNNAIRKYGSDNFKIELLAECEAELMNDLEIKYIKIFDSLTPNGYNLTEGGRSGRQSNETKILKSIALKGKNKGKILPKRKRKNNSDGILPKYMRRYKDYTGKEGYRISHHPKGKDKAFVSKNETMEEKYKKASNYLDHLNNLN